MNDEKYIKRECGCEVELVNLKGGPTKFYVKVCANHRADHKFSELLGTVVKSFDAGLQIPIIRDPR
jgi:hypothetical protein